MRYKIKFLSRACCYIGNYFAIYRWILTVMICILPAVLYAQTPGIPVTIEQQLENNAASNEEEEIEDDSYIQQLQQYNKHPVNLNTANENELQQLHLLNALQVQNLLR